MSKRVLYRMSIVLVPLTLIASACGLNMSGEPKIANEMEIPALPTATVTEPPAPTATRSESDLATQQAAPPTETPVPGESGGIDLTSADFDRGFQLYIGECATCHGAQAGVGPSLADVRDLAAERVPGMSAEEYLYQSIVDPGAFVVDGYQDIMPVKYATTLDQQQIADLITFMLEFTPEKMMAAANGESVDGGTTADSASTVNTPVPGDITGGDVPGADVIEQADTLTVRGRLVQGTANGETIPAGLPMQLYALDVHGNLVGTYDTSSTENGTYAFENVARAAGNVYLVQVRYDDVAQGAQIAAIQGDEDDITKDVTVYERTTDPSSIAVTWAQMLINYAPIEQFGLEVWLRVDLANTGDRIVTTAETAGANDWLVSVNIELPVASFGIQPMQAEGSQRYDVEVVDGVPVVKDTWPLRPGQVHTITIAYYLPYETGAVIDQAFDYPVVDASVLLPNDTVTLTSDEFDPEGQWRYRVDHGGVRVTELDPSEKINPDTDFTLVKAHDLIKPLAAGERMVFELAGRPTRTVDLMTASAQSGDSNSNTLPIVLAAGGVLVIALAVGLWWRQRGTVPPPDSIRQPVDDGWRPPAASAGKTTLLRAVAELDDAYEAGELDDDTYQDRRELLLDRLIPLMDDEDSPEADAPSNDGGPSNDRDE